MSNPQPSPLGARGNYSIVEGIAGVFVGLSSVTVALAQGLGLQKGIEEFVYHSPSWAQVGPLTGLLETLHTMQGLGMAVTIDVALSFGGGYVAGMGINEVLGLSRGGIQSQIEDLQFLLGRERK